MCLPIGTAPGALPGLSLGEARAPWTARDLGWRARSGGPGSAAKASAPGSVARWLGGSVARWLGALGLWGSVALGLWVVSRKLEFRGHQLALDAAVEDAVALGARDAKKASEARRSGEQ